MTPLGIRIYNNLKSLHTSRNNPKPHALNSIMNTSSRNSCWLSAVLACNITQRFATSATETKWIRSLHWTAENTWFLFSLAREKKEKRQGKMHDWIVEIRQEVRYWWKNKELVWKGASRECQWTHITKAHCPKLPLWLKKFYKSLQWVPSDSLSSVSCTGDACKQFSG